MGTALKASIRTTVVTIFIFCLCYTAVVYFIGRAITPYTADGSIIFNSEGKVIGSEMLAQSFEKPEYFHSRPMSGINLSPTGKEIKGIAQEVISNENASPANKIPADMVAPSGSGLDPHITVKSAKFQAERVALARNISNETVAQLIEQHTLGFKGLGFREPIVNVLMLNIDLDKIGKNNE